MEGKSCTNDKPVVHIFYAGKRANRKTSNTHHLVNVTVREWVRNKHESHTDRTYNRRAAKDHSESSGKCMRLTLRVQVAFFLSSDAALQ